MGDAKLASPGSSSSSSSSHHESDEEEWSSDEDTIGLQEAESIYASSPHNPEQRRRSRWGKTLGLLILAASLEKCVLLTAISSESLGALSITGDASISTIPATTRQIGAALAAAPASLLMGKVGRRYGFMAGGMFGVVGGVVSALALQLQSFPLLCLGTMAIGMEAGFGGYARYAAVEVVPQEQQPRALSLTVSGSVLSAVVGPRLAQYSHDWLSAQFAATYLLAAAVAVLFIGLTALNSGLPGRPAPAFHAATSRRLEALYDPPQTVRELCASRGVDGGGSGGIGFVGAVLAQASGYFMMVFVMTSTPLAMSARGIEYSSIAGTISLHAVGMFLPGLITGDLIKRTSCSHIMARYALCSAVARLSLRRCLPKRVCTHSCVVCAYQRRGVLRADHPDRSTRGNSHSLPHCAAERWRWVELSLHSRLCDGTPPALSAQSAH